MSRSTNIRRNILFTLLLCLGLVSLILLLEIIHVNEYETVQTIHRSIQQNIQKVMGPGLPRTKEIPKISKDDIYKELSKEMVNLPGDFWYSRVVSGKVTLEYNKTCAKIPNLEDLQFENIQWQVLDTPGEGHMQLYGAYFDNRPDSPLKTVRILGMVKQEHVVDEKLVFPDVHCQIWSKVSTKPILTKVFAVDYVWRHYWGGPKKDNYHPYLLTCVVPEDYKDISEAVSLVKKPCDTGTNLLKVNYDHEDRNTLKREENTVCVCMKAISEIEDKSLELVEWLEWLKIVGVSHVDFKYMYIHAEMRKVLDYYEDFVNSEKIYLHGNGPNTPYLQYLYRSSSKYSAQFDMLVYNDCLLRNMYKYNFVIPLELNEIIMIKKGFNNLQEILKDVPKDKSAYALQRIPFIEELSQKQREIPTFFSFVSTNYGLKASEKSPNQIRSLYNTKTMLMIHHHYPFESVTGKIQIFDIAEDTAVVEMHLKECRAGDSCLQRKQIDNSKMRFKDAVLTNAGEVIKYLGFV